MGIRIWRLFNVWTQQMLKASLLFQISIEICEFRGKISRDCLARARTDFNRVCTCKERVWSVLSGLEINFRLNCVF